MKTKEREPMPTDDFYRDLFVGGYFKPDDFLEDEWDIFVIKKSIERIEEYKRTLEQNNLIELL